MADQLREVTPYSPAVVVPPGWDRSYTECFGHGATAAAAGRADRVDVEVRCRYADWVDVVAGRPDPRRALASGRLRPRGAPRALWAARALFG